jgi:hypothetical protein
MKGQAMALPETFTTTAGGVGAELARRGIGPDEPAMIIIEPGEDAAGDRRDVRACARTFVVFREGRQATAGALPPLPRDI